MNNNIARYRKFLNYTQTDMAKLFGISLQAYSRKERGINAFNDNEKIMIKKLLTPHFPEVTYEELFFNEKVPKVENKEVN